MANKGFLGFPLGRNFTILSKNKILDKRAGSVVELSELSTSEIKELASENNEIEIKKEIEVITGIDSVKIDLKLKTIGGETQNNGFLIEVYESGSDGVLTKMPRRNVVDEINETTIKEGFENYIIIEIDK